MTDTAKQMERDKVHVSRKVVRQAISALSAYYMPDEDKRGNLIMQDTGRALAGLRAALKEAQS